MRASYQSATTHTSRSDALGLWYDVTLASVRGDAPDLTARQMAVLMTVYLRPAPHTVRSLAAHLNVTKAVITRALDTLGRHGFIDRARDPSDGRSVLIHRTGRGSSYLTAFADDIRGHGKVAAISKAGDLSSSVPVVISSHPHAKKHESLEKEVA